MQLAYDHLRGNGTATHRVLFLHGILGRGSNLRTVAQQFLQDRPEWDAILVDLRGHGRSPKGTPGPSLAAAAADVRELCGPNAVAVVGHSFGGKVALELLRHDPPRTLQHVMTLDSNPGPLTPMAEPGNPTAVLAMLRMFPTVVASRAAFVELVTAHGLPLPLAQWIAMSTEAAPEGGIRFALDLNEIELLLAEYYTCDFWPTVSNASANIHLVIAERSTSYSQADRERAFELAAKQQRLTVDVLPAGHWVHTDDREGLLRVMTARIPN